MGRIAITGAASFIGTRLLRRLVERRGPGAVVVLDVTHPPAALHGVGYRLVDLTLPGADRKLIEVFRDEDIDTVVHAAFFTDPRRDASYTHELESIGTLNLAGACSAAGVKHLVQRSFTAVYGARGKNPAFLTEEHEPHPREGFAWIQDKLEAERHTLTYARRYPNMTVTVLRLAPLLGPGLFTFYTRLFARRVVTVVMGYDPLVQFLHPDDALLAFEAAIERRIPGVFNIVPRDTISLLTTLHLAEKVTLSVPHPLAYALADAAWATGIGEAPGGFIDYVRYLFVADGAKAARELGFSARYGSSEALMDYLAYRYPERSLGAWAHAREARG